MTAIKMKDKNGFDIFYCPICDNTIKSYKTFYNPSQGYFVTTCEKCETELELNERKRVE